FAFEAFDRHPLREFWREHLDHDLALEAGFLPPKNARHPPPPQLSPAGVRTRPGVLGLLAEIGDGGARMGVRGKLRYNTERRISCAVRLYLLSVHSSIAQAP